MKRMKNLIIVIFGAILFAVNIQAQTTEFTYQGKLVDNSTQANGNYDFQFALYDALTGGTQQGSTITRSNVAVNSGIFSVKLDFGGEFDGGARFLEISVRTADPNDVSPYSTLIPRQAITSTPYAIKSKTAEDAVNAQNAVNAQTANTATNADNATNATNATNAQNATNADNADKLDGKDSSSFVLTTDSRLSNTRPPTSGSSFYIQNRTDEQPLSNFNISGKGSAAILNVRDYIEFNDLRFLRYDSTKRNIMFGLATGPFITTGEDNLFFGNNAGNFSSSGSNNIFVGSLAGRSNDSGNDNIFVGRRAGYSNKGSSNVYIGFEAGNHSTSGSNNVFIGNQAGWQNSGGYSNVFVGTQTGYPIQDGKENSFFGYRAGRRTSDANDNSFFGFNAGETNTSGNFNTAIGSSADVGLGFLQYATAIGAGAKVSTSNTIALGRTNGSDKVQIYGQLQVNGKIRVEDISGGDMVHLCRSIVDHTITNCSSSLRYKTNITTFRSGLSLVNKLQPITFDWKKSGRTDFGLGAEDVAKIEPLLVTYNENGQVEGVKYDRIGVVLLNAVKEQQLQITNQQEQIEEQSKIIIQQQSEMAALKALVCAGNPTAELCQIKEK